MVDDNNNKITDDEKSSGGASMNFKRNLVRGRKLCSVLDAEKSKQEKR
jgi:hypothetical protein